MATFNFIRISEETQKAVKVVVREAGYDLEKFQSISEKYFWIPKSLIIIEGNTATVADWFYNKNMAIDPYSVYMQALSNY